MPIEINEMKMTTNPEATRAFLQRQSDEFGVFFDMDRCIEITALLMVENKHITEKLRRLSYEPSLVLNDKDAVIKVLSKMGVPSSYFWDKKKKTVAFTAANRKEALTTAPPEAAEFLTTYDRYTTNIRNIGYLNGLASLPQSMARSKEGHRMTIGNPTWNILSTSRLSASDPGVQGVPREMPEIICDTGKYTLYRCDSKQIEPCINFSVFLPDPLIQNLIKYYKDAYFGLLHFCLMSLDDMVKWRDNFESFVPIEITDHMKDIRQTIKRMTNAGSYGSMHLDGIIPELAKAYEDRLVHHPMRIELEQKIRKDVRSGVTTFYGAFGTPVTPPPNTKYQPGDDGWVEHLVRCGINNPVQTTASELMMFSVQKAKEILSRAVDTHVAFYKHDEACFYISDEDMTNGIFDELKEITAYNVKGWIPIGCDPEIGIKRGSLPSYL